MMTSWIAGDLMDAVMTPCVSSGPMQSPGPLFTNALVVIRLEDFANHLERGRIRNEDED